MSRILQNGRLLLAATMFGVAALAACGSSGGGSTPGAPGAGSTSSPAGSASSSGTSSAGGPSHPMTGTLKTAKTSLGDVVVDDKGMTVYMYTKDQQGSGKSVCTGPCLTAWPPVLTDSDAPKAEGVAGTLGTIATPDGKKQVTLGGWPMYYYVKDKAPGDVTGQDVGKVWYVMGKDGKPIMSGASGTSSPTSPTSPASTSKGAGY